MNDSGLFTDIRVENGPNARVDVRGAVPEFTVPRKFSPGRYDEAAAFVDLS